MPMETDEEFEKAVKKILWALEPLPSGEQRVLALKKALEQLRTMKSILAVALSEADRENLSKERKN